MKTVLLYFCFCSLTWAHSELQSHYRQIKQKCVKEHQITVKSHHSKHGFYIFNYMYSSSEPNNQTQIKKEDKEHISSPTHGPVRNKESRGPVDNLTEIAQVTNDEQKYLTEMGNHSLERTTEKIQNLSRHHGNTRNWDFDQDHLEFFVDKRTDEFSTGYITSEIEGSGDNFPDQVDIHHAVTIGNKDHDQDKDHQVIVKEKDIHSGIANKSLKHSDIKIGVKENDARHTQEIKILMPKKTTDPQRKDYSKLFLKGSTDAPNKQPEKDEKGYINLLHKGKKDKGTSKSSNHLDIQSNLSTEFLEKIEPIRTGNNYTDVSKSSGIKISNEKSISNATEYKKDGGEYVVIIRKLDRPMNTSKISKPHEKVEVNVDIISNSHVEEANIIKQHKKDGAMEDVIRGQSNKHMEVAVTSSKHKKDYGKVDVRGRLINQEKINPGKTNKTQVTLSGMLNSRVGRFKVTKPPLKGKVNFLTRISDNERSDLNAKEEGRKGTLKVDFTYGKSNMAKEDVGFTEALQKGLGSHEKINRKNHRVSLNDPEVHKKGQNRSGVTFQDVDNDAKENINSNIGTGIVAEFKKSNTIESSNTEAEYHGEKAVEFKSALSLSHGSNNNIQHAVHIPKNDHLKAQGHFLSAVKKEKVPKTGKKSAEVRTGTNRSGAAKQHHRYGAWRKKNSQHNKKRQPVKKAHVSDSSPSSESEENNWNVSNQSYKDYQNGQFDRYQSSESVEIDLSAERNQRDDHSHMEDSETASQEKSKEFRSTD